MASVFETAAHSPATPQPDATDSPKLDRDKLERYLDGLKFEQNLLLGLFAGLLAAALGAAAWAAVTLITGYQIGWMAVGVGFVVAFAVRVFGKGLSPVYGVMGAGLALVGCVAGNLAAIYGSGARELGVSLAQMTPFMTPAIAMELLVDSFHPLDLLFYGLALYQGYKYSFRRVDAQQVVAAASA